METRDDQYVYILHRPAFSRDCTAFNVYIGRFVTVFKFHSNQTSNSSTKLDLITLSGVEWFVDLEEGGWTERQLERELKIEELYAKTFLAKSLVNEEVLFKALVDAENESDAVVWNVDEMDVGELDDGELDFDELDTDELDVEEEEDEVRTPYIDDESIVNDLDIEESDDDEIDVYYVRF